MGLILINVVGGTDAWTPKHNQNWGHITGTKVLTKEISTEMIAFDPHHKTIIKMIKQQDICKNTWFLQNVIAWVLNELKNQMFKMY